MIILFDIHPIKEAFSRSLFQLMDLNVELDGELLVAAEIGLIPAQPYILDVCIRETLSAFSFDYDHDARVYTPAFRQTVYDLHAMFHRSKLVFNQPQWPSITINNDLLCMSTTKGNPI